MRIDVVAYRQFLGRDHTLGLVADVEEHLVLVDLDDDTRDDVAIIEVDEGLVDRRFEAGVAEIVLDDGLKLKPCVGGIAIARRVVVTPICRGIAVS